MYRPIRLAGGSYRHTDRGLTAQRTVNFWPQRQDAGNEKAPYVLESFYGLKAFATGDGVNRGMLSNLGTLYKLTGTTLSSVDQYGTHTTLGTIPGDSRAVFADFGVGFVVTADNVAYWWNGTTFTTATDVDFETPQAVTVINSRAIYDGDTGRFGVSDVGAPLTINSLNYATIESRADNLLRPYAFQTTVYMFGEGLIEQWWNNAQVDNPPMSRIEGGTINIGLGARHSVANDGQVMYFFGADDQVYSLTGSTATPLLPMVIVREISAFSTKTDAVGWCMSLDGQWFYVLKFPTASRTFIYPKGGEWFELSSGVLGARYIGDSYAYCYGKHLVADEIGNIFELDPDTYSENGSVIRRERILSPIHGGQFGAPGKELEIKFLKLIGKTGTGIVSGQGSDPVVMLSWSYDGQSFGTEVWGNVGEMGVFTEILFDIGEAHENWIFKITSSDPVYSCWHSAGIEMEICP